MTKIKFIAPALFAIIGSQAIADPIDTFKSICFKNAGNVAAIRADITKNGYKIEELKKDSFMGYLASTDESVQVNAFTNKSFECAVTTSDMRGARRLKKRFFREMGLNTKEITPTAVIAGTTYTFFHNTKGGEAFVMYVE